MRWWVWLECAMRTFHFGSQPMAKNVLFFFASLRFFFICCFALAQESLCSVTVSHTVSWIKRNNEKRQWVRVAHYIFVLRILFHSRQNWFYHSALVAWAYNTNRSHAEKAAHATKRNDQKKWKCFECVIRRWLFSRPDCFLFLPSTGAHQVRRTGN